PSPPNASGWTFTGWFTDAELAAAFDFATPIAADTVLHAAWAADAVIPPTTKPTPPATDPPSPPPARATPLAKTGAIDPSSTGFTALAALTLGGLLLARRRTRQG
ncbi:InlB B-repeat-containing protein, partial [Kitasatospora indigofera]|uniref:InlB B-repeat-containing protein n=1 Tax=Kitasatospora indigofera TaxID=67307 RepID=UPI0036A9D755